TLKSKQPLDQLRQEIRNYPYREYWGGKIFTSENEERVLESFRDKYVTRNYVSLNHSIFTYFIKDSLRKYFGGEVHAERIFATNRFPFFDDEFVEAIFKSTFSAINNTFLKPTYSERIRSQLFYAHILKSYHPELLKYRTDHGYAPAFLFWPIPLLFIGPQVYLRRRLRKKRGYKEFNDEEWAERQFKEQSSLLEKEYPFFEKTKVKECFDTKRHPFLHSVFIHHQQKGWYRRHKFSAVLL
ncbi:MAG: hypothetical protein NT148_02170, partial [Candidatus Nealsonbacteria bacterium]|nr:hypothetical protein [Candidatus Nealsonbacteria bacterium]